MRWLSSLYFAWISLICGCSTRSAFIELICLIVSGTISSRTITVRPTIDQPQLEPDVVVQHREQPVGRVDQRLEDVCEDEGHRNRRCALTGSYPPWLNGLQRSSRQTASTKPRSGP